MLDKKENDRSISDIQRRRIESTKQKQNALKAGKKIYASATKCSVCGSVERYVSTQSCISCTKKKNKIRREKNSPKEVCLLQYHYLHTVKEDKEFKLLCSAF